MKKLIILKHGGGELANQLWNYTSIYAYGLEIKTPVENPSFFEYHSFFRLLQNESLQTKIFSLFFRTLRRRSYIINKIARGKYLAEAKIKILIHDPCVVSSENIENTTRYLPPSGPMPARFENCNILYFTGWLFRNPLGLKKWRNELLKTFAPNKKIETKVNEIVAPLRQKYGKIIGIHIRLGDYKTFKNGKYLIPEERMREIVSEYAKENILNIHKTAFIITSDSHINETLYENLNVFVSKENAVTDLFLLSKCDIIIGSDSSFGAFASWYGNIPHIIAKKENMDWAYYSDKQSFFYNKYSTLAHY